MVGLKVMAQLLLSAAGSCELNVVFNVFSVDWSSATRRESASALLCQAILVRYGPLLPYREDSPQ
jgi:hypothetical protein